MIEVFVHSRRPLLRSECAEEGMRVPGALRFPAFVKLSDAIFELPLLAGEIPLIRNHKTPGSWTVPGEWFVVGESWADKWSENPANEHTG